MRAVIQRVAHAQVSSEGRILGQIGPGLLILLGIEATDEPADSLWLRDKVLSMRIFSDPEGKMNLDIGQIGGSVLVVSQFTLHASTRKGNRPSFIRAARPEVAIPLYEAFLLSLAASGCVVQSGAFGADMQVSLVNDGPVTIIIDSKQRE
jgi:D-aminoacyl-tRNA deacylase